MEEVWEAHGAEVIFEEEPEEEVDEIQLHELDPAPIKMEDNKVEVLDPREEINLRTPEN